MSGNVWEWCSDHWNEDYKSVPNDRSAWLNGKKETSRVVCGGSWDDIDSYCHISNRDWYDANLRSYSLSFRLARY